MVGRREAWWAILSIAAVRDPRKHLNYSHNPTAGSAVDQSSHRPDVDTACGPSEFYLASICREKNNLKTLESGESGGLAGLRLAKAQKECLDEIGVAPFSIVEQITGTHRGNLLLISMWPYTVSMVGRREAWWAILSIAAVRDPRKHLNYSHNPTAGSAVDQSSHRPDVDTACGPSEFYLASICREKNNLKTLERFGFHANESTFTHVANS
ncbi:hypothetical protein AHF37_05036 [Paragonimus kellicotti]|nr:hypothetical protein AHF37_05036 [Paragonimus kellicotti]